MYQARQTSWLLCSHLILRLTTEVSLICQMKEYTLQSADEVVLASNSMQRSPPHIEILDWLQIFGPGLLALDFSLDSVPPLNSVATDNFNS